MIVPEKITQLEILLDQLETAKGPAEMKQVIFLTVELFRGNPAESEDMVDILVKLVNNRLNSKNRHYTENNISPLQLE